MTQKERQERSRKEIYQAALEEHLFPPRHFQGNDVPLLLQ